MKKLFALIVLVLPMIAFAGPEDHVPGAVYTTSAHVPYYLMELRFDSIGLSQDEAHVILYTLYGNFSGDFTVVNSSRHNEDIVTYTATKEIFSRVDSTGCGSAEKAVATIRARNHVSFGMSPKDIDISIDYTTTPDICHSRPQTQTIQYQLAN